METFEDILAAIHAGIPPKEIASQVAWEEITEEDREQLLTAAREMGDDPSGYQLFLALNAISQDEWFTLRVLGYAIQHPTLILADRQNTLKTMRRILDRLQAKLDADPQSQENLGWQRLFEAAYFVLNAQICEQAGNVTEALQNYRRAHIIYQELGFSQPLQKVAGEIKRLQPVPAIAKPPAPPALKVTPSPAPPSSALPPKPEPTPVVEPAPVVSQQAETERLAAQIQAQNRALSELQARIRQLQGQRDRLTSEIAVQEERLKTSPQPDPAHRQAAPPDQEQVDQITALTRQVRRLQEDPQN